MFNANYAIFSFSLLQSTTNRFEKFKKIYDKDIT